MQLWKKILISFVLAIVLGIFLPSQISLGSAGVLDIVELIDPIGIIFLKLIKVILPFLIFGSLVNAIVNIGNNSSVGTLSLKAAVAYMMTTLSAVCIGLIVGIIGQPGIGVVLSTDSSIERVSTGTFNVKEYLLGLVPDNIFKVLYDGKMVPLVLFSIMCGFIVNNIEKKEQKILKDLINAILKLSMKAIAAVVEYSPYAVFTFIYAMVVKQGLDSVLAVFKLVVYVLVAYCVQYIMFTIMIIFIGRLSPFPFIRKSWEYQSLALSTCSSKASLPTTMECLKKMGVSQASRSLVLPMGASMNMDGLAIKLSISAVFFAQVFNIDLSFYDYVLIILTSTIGSMGGAGITRSYLVMLPVVLTTIGIPTEVVAFVIGADNFLDMMSTFTNITGDAVITLILDKVTGKLDQDKYYE
ncbi:MAG: dicarboxylate/amino acid:cation symporter [Pseudomonadota bacterium]